MSNGGMGGPAPANNDFTNQIGDLTQADLDQMVDQIQNRDLGLLDQAQQAVLDGVGADLDNLPNADQLTDADRQAIADAVANGDPDAVRDLLGDDVNSPAGQDLVDRAVAMQTLNDLRDQLAAGDFDGGDLANLINVFQDIDLTVENQETLWDLTGQLAVDQQLTDWLQETDPGMGDVPFGPDVPLVMVPGLPEGLMMPLDSGAVMIGTGAPGEAIQFGTGNPFEVAGLPVALPGVEPAPEATGTFTAGQIMLANPTTGTVNYSLNQEPQQMTASTEQTLDGTRSWVIEFDRGGSFGMARYQLSEGYYYFKSTERGWELVRKTFKATLDNTENTFAFSYVLDDQVQTINPGETHDLTSALPPVLRFDNGKGEETLRRLDTGSFKVAIGTDTKLDIYAADAVSSPSTPREAAAQTNSVVKSSVRVDVKVAATAAGKNPATAPKSEVAAASRTKSGQKLPKGFTLFDPVKTLKETRSARKLPASFQLFRTAAEQVKVARVVKK